MDRYNRLKKIILVPYLVPLSVIVLVLLCMGLFTLRAAPLVQAGQESSSKVTVYETAPAQAFQVEGTVDAHPTFTVPGDMVSTRGDSQPPKNGVPTYAVPSVTPSPTPSPTPEVSPTTAFSIFAIQVVSYPGQTNNNSTVPIQLHANQPYALLQLTATYTLPPFFYQIDNQRTDANGDVTIFWPINLTGAVASRGINTTTAHFYVNGTSTDGQVATSAMESIQVITPPLQAGQSDQVGVKKVPTARIR